MRPASGRRLPGWRAGALAAVLAGSLLAMLGLDPIAQDQAYHQFADRRPWLGIRNFADVASNAAFLLAGGWALLGSRYWVVGAGRRCWCTLFTAVALVAAGSGWYHLDPRDATLVWDRLPMTVGFMALFVALLAEHVDPRFQRYALLPALLLGAATVGWWRLTGDLRAYVWVQFAPLLAIPLVVALYPTRYTRSWYLLLALACYALAKLTEARDVEIFQLTGERLSGHTLKHLLAALAPVWLHLMLIKRRPRPA